MKDNLRKTDDGLELTFWKAFPPFPGNFKRRVITRSTSFKLCLAPNGKNEGGKKEDEFEVNEESMSINGGSGPEKKEGEGTPPRQGAYFVGFHEASSHI